MNFFKSIQSTVNSIPNMGKNNQSNRNNDYIVNLIRSCTYPDDVKFAIQKSVRQVMHVYPQYIVDKIEFAQNNSQKRYIQLKGQISVDSKGNIALFIMYPITFPKAPPFLRILNPNPQQLSVVSYYKKYQSKTDARSYLLNDCLQEVKSWKPNSSVASLIIEVNDIVRNNFPFQSQNQFGNQNQMYQQQQAYNPNYYNQPNLNMNKNNSWGQPQSAKQPPIPFKTSASSAQIIPKSQKFITTQKAKIAEIQLKHQAVLPVLQVLDADRKAMEMECKNISKQTQQMIDFVNHSQEHQISNFANLVTPADEMSEKILNYSASIKARQDTIQLLESKFNQESISFDDFLKNIRKIQESKFIERFMLHEALQGYSHIKQF